MSTGGRFVVLAIAGFVALSMAGGGSAVLVPKVTLTVVVSGNGGVVSHPAGISCPTTCKLKVRRGVHVVLTAQPDEGSQIGSWSAGCGTKKTCTVTMTKSKLVSVSFKTPPPPPAPIPPPAPPPPAKSGHYTGTYSDGDSFQLDVAGTQVGNISFNQNGHCANGGTEYGQNGAPGPFTIQSDGSFQGTYPYMLDNGTGTLNINGKFAQDGTASGTISDTFTFSSGDFSGVTCMSTGTWTAKVSP